MTNATNTNTASGAADLLDLIDAYAEARHMQGHSSYNNHTKAALQAVVAALASAPAPPVAEPAENGTAYAELPDGIVYTSAAQDVLENWFEEIGLDMDVDDAKRLFDKMTVAARGQAPAGAYKDSTPHLNVGDSSFESWYAGYVKEGTKGLKQHCRDAYAAGMGDPLVGAAPTPQADRVTAPAAGAVAGLGWPELRNRLAMAMLGFGGRQHQTLDAASQVLDTITEPGMPLAILRAAPTPAAQADSVTAPAGGGVVGPDGMMRDGLRSMIEGMSVSVDVSTDDATAGHRYFGTVTEVMECQGDKHGVTLLVQDAEPNFTAQADSVLEDAALLHGLHRMTTMIDTPAGKAYRDAMEEETHKVYNELSGDMARTTIEQYRRILNAGLEAAHKQGDKP